MISSEEQGSSNEDVVESEERTLKTNSKIFAKVLEASVKKRYPEEDPAG